MTAKRYGREFTAAEVEARTRGREHHAPSTETETERVRAETRKGKHSTGRGPSCQFVRSSTSARLAA